MYLLYADETNTNASDEFFIYGGVAIPAHRATDLAAAIEAARCESKYEPDDELKFSTAQKERPDHISCDVHREAKNAVLQAAAKHEVRLFACLVLSAIAKNKDDKLLFQMNTVLRHFNGFLREQQCSGLVVIDQLDQKKREEQNKLLAERFSKGVSFDDKHVRLKKIVGIHPASVGQSHFCSLIDIVIGSLRFAVKSFEKNKSMDKATILLKRVSPLCVRENDGRIHRRSICFNPHEAYEKHCKRYRELAHFMESAGLNVHVPTVKA